MEVRTRSGVPLSQRAVERLAGALGRRRFSRRGFLGRAAFVGSALAVDPWGYILKPGTAYATICGSGNTCGAGWTAMCCTINEGANLCPPGSYVAGWWKVDDSAFCNGAARYYVDCNREPAATCQCHCADGACDQRKVCCNVFRYGQCNQHIGGVTEVVCRLILCTPPWEWDPSCTTTARTDENTRSHSSDCLPGPGASPIQIKHQDLGLVGAGVGALFSEGDAEVGGGRVADCERGLILWRADLGAHDVYGGPVDRYLDLGRERSTLGYPVRDQQAVAGGLAAHFEAGSIWWTSDRGAFTTTGPIHEHYVLREQGAEGRLGYPKTDVVTTASGNLRMDFAGGFTILYRADPTETRTFATDRVGADGAWPEDADVPPTPGNLERLNGDDRISTAVRVSQVAFADGAPTAFLARADGFADALGGGVAAALAGGPILLTPTATLPLATRDELDRLGATRIVLLGGIGAISQQIEDDLRTDPALTVERLAGTDRFATAAAISQATFPGKPDRVYVANGFGFADALAGVPAAIVAACPLLLVEKGSLPGATRDELARIRPAEVVILGGESVVSKDVAAAMARYAKVVSRRAGTTRFDTAAAISADAFPTADEVTIVNGLTFPDALAAGPLTSLRVGPVLLVDTDVLPAATERELTRLTPGRITVVGGPSVVSDELAATLAGFTRTDRA